MEPLVIFGACLVVWCGYLTASDALGKMRDQRCRCPVKLKFERDEAGPLGTGIGGSRLRARLSDLRRAASPVIMPGIEVSRHSPAPALIKACMRSSG